MNNFIKTKFSLIKIKRELRQILESKKTLKNLELENVYTETIGIFKKYLGAGNISIYSLDRANDFLRLKIYTGDLNSKASSIDLDSSTNFSRVVEDKVIIKFSDTGERDFPILSGPLEDSNEVIAIVNIESLESTNNMDYNYKVFKAILDWVNLNLLKAHRFDQINNIDYYENTKIFKFDSFIKRLDIEKTRSKLYNLEYIHLTYTTRDEDLEDIYKRISSLLRFLDIVGYDKTTSQIHILLPATPLSKTYVLEGRFREKLSDVLVLEEAEFFDFENITR